MAGLGDRPPGDILVDGKKVPRNARIAFEVWWDEKVVRDTDGSGFSRRGLVLALSNHEGGAHVDPKVKVAYARLANSEAFGWSVSDLSGERPMDSNPVFPAIRQITWEVLTSLHQQEHLLI
ncbi:hypothetical protein O1W68_07730 [Rhodococcus sp. H36-A4]|uniref:hypothetical protein n=1 Tax=Rhodococcus sp. H36-A4 TaxID=3004353 RepID=UPI0022AEC20F|nr:hypothetical protein [Rhodococcus sp. H36-A4]MCZ4077825.1 hypothetical protein [Rhodococcus sp. H36-A4]